MSSKDSFCKPFNHNGKRLYGAAAREARLKKIGGVDGFAKKLTGLILDKIDSAPEEEQKQPHLTVIKGSKSA